MAHTRKKFSKAWDNLNSRPIDIRNLPRSRNGKDCNCICVDCKKPLEACQGYVNAWYFRHQIKTDCKGGPMTALHLSAQYLLIGNHTIKTKEGDVSYSNGEMEYVLPRSRFEADISGVKVNDNRFVIEIFVEHQLEENKINFLQQEKVHTIEIDLSDVDANIKDEDLLHLLLNDVSRQRIIYSPNATLPELVKSVESPQLSTKQPSWIEDLFSFAFVGAILYGAYRIIKGPARKPRTLKKSPLKREL